MAAMKERGYVGIDVAFAKNKRLPVVVCTLRDARLEPLPLRKANAKPPLGKGNALILADETVAEFVDKTVAYLRTIESEFGVRVERIAIDAPSEPRPANLPRRLAEVGLDQRGISCITTPSHLDFLAIRREAEAHLASGGAESRMPAANQLWMLVGFELFRRLRQEWECIEVFPQATVVVLGAGKRHKSHEDGLIAQLTAVAHRSGWPMTPELASLADVGYGSSHDRFDAYSSAWIASLDEADRMAIGCPPNDAIWVPQP